MEGRQATLKNNSPGSMPGCIHVSCCLLVLPFCRCYPPPALPRAPLYSWPPQLYGHVLVHKQPISPPPSSLSPARAPRLFSPRCLFTPSHKRTSGNFRRRAFSPWHEKRRKSFIEIISARDCDTRAGIVHSFVRLFIHSELHKSRERERKVLT